MNKLATSDYWATVTPEQLLSDIKDNLDVNCLGKYNISPLGFACSMPNPHTIDNVKILLDNGSDINHVDSMGYTPLFYALHDNPIKELISLLIERGADLDIFANCRNNPLLLTVKSNDFALFKLLIANGAVLTNKYPIHGSHVIINIMDVVEEYAERFEKRTGKKDLSFVNYLRAKGFKTNDDMRKEEDEKELQKRLENSQFFALVHNSEMIPRTRGRILKWAEKKINLNGEIMTNEDWMNKKLSVITHKSIYKNDYGINGRLKNTEVKYYLEDDNFYNHVPKIVWDIIDVPIK